jgi:maleylacetoacetate isomerase
MKLYSFPTSSASWRVRTVLHLKGILFETATVNMPAKEQRGTAYLKINPQNRVPSLQLDDGTILTQSLAIIDYLEQIRPTPSVYPANPVMRAKAMAVAIAIASEIQPLNNSTVTDYVRETRGLDQAGLDAWMTHWIRSGFRAIEQLIPGDHFSFGQLPSIADVCLVPQVFNAHRFNVDISDFPKINAVADVAGAHPAFAKAHPNLQPAA